MALRDLGHCPFCGRRIKAGEYEVLHQEPACAIFEQASDALDFIIQVHKARGLPEPKPE